MTGKMISGCALSAEEMERERADFKKWFVEVFKGCVPGAALVASLAEGVYWEGWKARAALARHPKPECGELVDKIGTVEIPEIVATFDGLYLIPVKPLNAGDHLMAISQHQRICKDMLRLLAERDAEIERLQRAEKNDAIAYKAVIQRQHELREERDILQKQLDRFHSQSHGIPALSEIEKLRARVADLTEALTQAVEYLDVSRLENIGSGSALHHAMRNALAHPSGGKEEET